MVVIGVDDRGVEPWGRLVDGGREGCERGSIVVFRSKRVDKVKDEWCRERGRKRGVGTCKALITQ